MSKPIDFIQKKAAKNGVLTPKELLQNHLDNVDQIETVVIVTTTKTGVIKTGWSNNESTSSIGMLEVGKQTLLSDMWEEM